MKKVSLETWIQLIGMLSVLVGITSEIFLQKYPVHNLFYYLTYARQTIIF